MLWNIDEAPFTIQPGDRIAQLVVTKLAGRPYAEVYPEDLAATSRGEKGFGSTGR